MKCRRLAEESCEEQDYRPGWEGLQGSRALLSPAPPQGPDNQELTSLWWLPVRADRVNRSRAHRTDDLRAVGLDVCSVIQRLPLMPDPRFHPQHHRNKQKNKEKLKQKRTTNELNVYLKNYYFLFSHLKKIKIKLKVSSTDYKPTLQSFPSSYKTQKLRARRRWAHWETLQRRHLSQTQSGTTGAPLHATAHFTLNHCSQEIFHWGSRVLQLDLGATFT